EMGADVRREPGRIAHHLLPVGSPEPAIGVLARIAVNGRIDRLSRGPGRPDFRLFNHDFVGLRRAVDKDFARLSSMFLGESRAPVWTSNGSGVSRQETRQ